MPEPGRPGPEHLRRAQLSITTTNTLRWANAPALSTWHPELRGPNMLIVVDVSGSMGEALPGTGSTKIDLVRQGINQVNALLPSTAQLGLWQFGSQLALPNDWQPLTGVAPLTTSQRTARRTAVAGLPNQVILFTDGVNQDDPVSISIDQLKAGLGAAGNQKYIQLSMFGFGSSIPVDALSAALRPVEGQVDELTNADQVIGAYARRVRRIVRHPG